MVRMGELICLKGIVIPFPMTRLHIAFYAAESNVSKFGFANIIIPGPGQCLCQHPLTGAAQEAPRAFALDTCAGTIRNRRLRCIRS